MGRTINQAAEALWFLGGIPIRSAIRLGQVEGFIPGLLHLFAIMTPFFAAVKPTEGLGPFLALGLLANLAGVLPLPPRLRGEEFHQSIVHFLMGLVLVPLAGLATWVLWYHGLLVALAAYRLRTAKESREATPAPQGKAGQGAGSHPGRPPAPKPLLPKGPPPGPKELRQALRQTLILPEEAEEEILQTVTLLQRYREFRREWGLEVPTALLMVGPPGTGKTSIARFIAEAAGYPFFTISPAEIKDMWFGESEKRLQALFRQAEAVAPSIIFMDEIEAIAPSRHLVDHGATEGILTQLLQETEGLKGRDRPVFLLAATNIPEKVDPAMLSRFGARLTIPLPGRREREEILRLLLKEKAKGVELGYIADLTQGWSGRDLRHLVQRVAVRLTAEGRKEPTTGDFLEAMRRMRG